MAKSLDQTTADTEAKRRWGPRAIARPYEQSPGYVEIVLDVADLIGWNTKKFGPLMQVIGFAETWEDALANADARQYQISPAAIDDTGRKSDTEEKTELQQMNFFNLW